MPARDQHQNGRIGAAPEHELALLLCQTASLRGCNQSLATGLAQRIDYDELVRVLSANSLLAMCGTRLRELCGEHLPRSFIGAVEAAEASLRPRTLLLETVARQLLAALEDNGISALPLKGVLLARRIHAAGALRPSHDIDILVARSDLPAAIRVIEWHDYAVADDVCFADGLPALHHTLHSLDGRRPRVELHWRIHWHGTSFSEQMLARSACDDGGIRRAAPADELASLLLFYQRDSFLGLKLAADIAAWWDTYNALIPPLALVPFIRAHPELRDALLAGAAVAQRVVGVPFGEVLIGAPLRPRRTAWAARLGDWTLGELDPQAIANLALIDWLLTPAGGQRAFARRYLFQPPRLFARDHGLAELPRARDHVRRFAHGLARLAKAQARLGIALWRIRGGRFWSPLPSSIGPRPLCLDVGARHKKDAQRDVVEARVHTAT